MATRTFCDLCGREIKVGAGGLRYRIIVLPEGVAESEALRDGRAHRVDEACAGCATRATAAPPQQSPESFIAGYIRQTATDLAEAAREAGRVEERARRKSGGLEGVEVTGPDVEEAIRRMSEDVAKVVRVEV